MSSQRQIHIGGASGYWGESDMAVPQFLDAIEAGEKLDYIDFDYLAEITMSILARQRSQDSNLGYASDFVPAALKPHLSRISRHGVKIISNAGGVNPVACGAAVRLHEALGGGMASMRFDPQGKSYGQILLQTPHINPPPSDER